VHLCTPCDNWRTGSPFATLRSRCACSERAEEYVFFVRRNTFEKVIIKEGCSKNNYHCLCGLNIPSCPDIHHSLTANFFYYIGIIPSGSIVFSVVWCVARGIERTVFCPSWVVRRLYHERRETFWQEPAFYTRECAAVSAFWALTKPLKCLYRFSLVWWL